MQPQPPSSPGWGQPEQQPYSQYPQFYSQQPQTQYPPQQPLYPMPGQMQPPQQPPKKRRSRRNLIIGIVAAIIVIAIIAATASHSSSPSTSSSTPTVQATTQATSQPTSQTTSAPTKAASTPTPIPTQKPTPTFITFGDGIYQVGKDIKPGTYRTRTGSTNCYYERLSGFSGDTSDIIANNNTDNPAIVTILPTDKGFSSQGCGTWTNNLSQITSSKTSFSDGMYIVGVDIAPGTYKNTASQGCYYARLSGFSNSPDDIIANNNTDTAAIVTISALDKGFQSTNCGTWTKI